MNKLITLRELVLEKNKVLNLTAITDPSEFDRKHIQDSLILTEYLPLYPGMKVADLGTGGGFPGLPLAITNPEVDFHLIDSVNKKLVFIDEATKELKLTNVTTHHGRFEDLAHNKDHREKYDVVVSRAVANLSVLLEYMVGFSKVDGLIVCYKSQRFSEELEDAKNALKMLKLELISENKYSLGDAVHTLAIFKKTKKTPPNYPRKAGVPSKNPL